MSPDLAAFAPRRVLDHDLMSGGAVLSREATTLFVDLEGFTDLTGRLGEHGSRGTEQLSGLLRTFFGSVTDEVTEHGGDPIAFGGDALTFVFDGPAADVLDAARTSADAVQRIARELSGAATLAGPAVLRTRIGIARGTVATTVARSHGRAVPVHVGPGLDLAEAAEAAARPGAVVVHRSAHDHGASTASETPDSTHENPRFDLLAELVSPWVVDRLEAGPESHRQVSSAFVRFPPVDPGEAGEFGEFVDRIRLLLDIVEEWEGEVVQVSGGDKGVVGLVVFGAPLAHADDPSRATEAMLRLRERVPSVAAGVATGPVFAALLGSRTRIFPTHFGLAVTTAARLMQSAAPGELLVDATTWAEVSGTLRSPGDPRSLTLKGHTAPVQAYAVDGWRRAEATPRATSHPPLVGRASELVAIEQFLERSADGAGGALTLVGDPGIGKTRLLHETAERARTRGFRVVVTDVDVHPRGRSQPVWQELLGTVLGLPPGASAGQWRTALDAALPDLRDDVELPGRLLRPLLGSVLEDRYGEPPEPGRPDIDLGAELAQSLVGQISAAGSRETPLLIALDNAHGLDGFSASILDGLGQLLSGSRTGLLLTRDTGDAGGRGESVRLAELAAEDAVQVAADAWRQAGGGSAPSWLGEVVTASAGANPLFVRTVTEAVWAKWDIGSPPPVPDPTEDPHRALTGVLREHVDRLPHTDREVLDALAVVGLPCGIDLVGSVLGDRVDPSAVAAAAGRLAERGLVDITAGEDGERYRLRHRVLRDVAHASMSHATRDRAHRAVVDVLVTENADPVEIAEHVRHLDDADLVRRWYPLAAASARRSWNLPQAAIYLEAVRPLVTGAGRDRLDVELLEVLLIAGRAAEVLEAVDQPTDPSEPSLRVRRLQAVAEAAFACGEFARAEVAARELMRLTDGVDEVRYQRAAELLVLATCELGDTHAGVAAATAFVDRALATEDDRALTTARAALGAALLIAGRAEEAAEHYRAALEGALTTGEVVQQVHILSDLAGCAYESGDHQGCTRLLSEARALADRIGYRRHLAFNLTNEAQLRSALGDPYARACAAGAVDRNLEVGDLLNAANALHTWLTAEPGPAADIGRWLRLSAIDGGLGRTLAEAEDRADLAVVAARAGRRDEAFSAASAAERAAGDLKQPGVSRRARLGRLLACSSAKALTEFDRLAAEARAEDANSLEQAEIAMCRWRLGPTADAHGAAVELATRAFAEQPSAPVRAWFDELGTTPPPAPDPLPPPVGIGRSSGGPVELDAAFDRVEDAIRERQRSE